MACDATRTFPAGLLGFLLAGALASVAISQEVIYKYVDEKGTVNFTEQWQLIPEKYHDRVQLIDPATGQQVKPRPLTTVPAPGRKAPPQAPAAPRPAPESLPFYAAWLEQFANLTMSAPSPYQLGVGLLALTVIIGAITIMRLSPNPLIALLLRAVIVLVLAGSVYAMYFANLNERISEVTHEPVESTVTGKEMILKGQEAASDVKKSLEQVAAPIRKLKDATVGKIEAAP